MDNIIKLLKREARKRYGYITPLKRGEITQYNGIVYYWFNDRKNSTHVTKFSLKFNKVVQYV